jgi:beta-lactamase superfamily II metal-dependent hydrolase
VKGGHGQRRAHFVSVFDLQGGSLSTLLRRFWMVPAFFDGVEVDVISIGDADCIVVTQWNNSLPHRILIDGGCAGDAQVVKEFLLSRGYTYFWAVVCTHLHNDHASGLIKILQDKTFTFSNGWMHNINKHLSAETLRRASSAVDGVKEVVETTKELAAAFASRNITPIEPFAGMTIATWPEMTVLGPSLPYYRSVMTEFTKVKVSIPIAMSSFTSTAPVLSYSIPLSELAIRSAQSPFASLFKLLPPSTSTSNLGIPFPPLTGALGNSSVQEHPTTQSYNNTSVILGVTFGGNRLLFTADAGSEAFRHVDASWNRLTYLGVPHHGSDGNLSQKDIERFCPQFASISAKGDSSHPSRAIVSGLVKAGAKVASTHKSGNLQFWVGNVPARPDYGPLEYLKGTGEPEPVVADWARILLGLK